MGKTTVSSSTFSNVAKSSYKPKLKSTKFQFKSPFQKQKAEKAEGLKTQIQGSAVTANVAATLGETNRILVEIQQQLALDFANRIAEKKQLLELSRRTTLKQKAVKKEAFVERGKGRGPKIGALGAQILAPTKSIFDKIIEFLSLIATGIVINNAWKWLQDPANRKKLADVFAFLKTYWKEIIAGVVLVKLTGAALKVLGFLNTLRKIFKRLSGLRRPPKPPSPGGTKPGSGPGGGGCGPVTGKGGCLDQLSATSEVANNLARTLFATGFAVNYFKRFALKTATTPATTQQPIQAEAEAEAPRMSPASYGPLITEGISKAIAEDRSQSIEMPDGGRVFIDRRGRVKSVKTGEEVKRGEEESRFYLNMFTGTNLPAILRILFGLSRGGIGTRTTLGTNVLPGVPQTGTLPGFRPPGAGLSTPLLNQPQQPKPTVKIETPVMPGQKVSRPVQSGPTRSKISKKIRLDANNIDAQVRDFGWRPNGEPQVRNASNVYNPADMMGSKERLLKIYRGEGMNVTDLQRWAARRLLNKPVKNGGFGLNLDKVQNMSETIKKQIRFDDSGQLTKDSRQLLENLGFKGSFSKGGTVFGQGSQSVDSVPAMLAPGEEVIRASAANLFRPLLKDINDNAGRMWSSLSNSINLQKRNNIKQEDVNKEFGELVETFNEYLSAELAKKEKEKARIANATGGGTSHMHMRSSSVKPKPKSSPTSIKTYNIRKQSSKNGQPTIGNMPMPAMNLAGNQSPEAPNTNVQETSSTPISISSFDSSNPYIAESLAEYGIFV